MSLGDSANHSSGLFTRHGRSISSTLPAVSWRSPRLGWSAVLARSRTLMVMFFTSSAHLDRGCWSVFCLGRGVSGQQKGRGSLSGSAAWRLPISWSQLVGGLQAVVPGAYAVARPMSPLRKAWRSRTTKFVTEAWPQMGMPREDGLLAVIGMLVISTGHLLHCLVRRVCQSRDAQNGSEPARYRSRAVVMSKRFSRAFPR